MSSDIVERLRDLFYPDQIEWEAADEIERLRAENATLRRNEWRLIWGLCTQCGRNQDQEARRG